MSIRQRVLDAEALWLSGQREGAWIQAMIAAAATARKKWPKPIPDNKAFKNYIRSVTFTILTGKPKPWSSDEEKFVVVFGDRPFEDILYEDFRCAWVHEAGLTDAALSPSTVSGGRISGTLVVGDRTSLPEHWVLNLLNAIRWSPDNRDQFPEFHGK